jgi:hypothetical protein
VRRGVLAILVALLLAPVGTARAADPPPPPRRALVVGISDYAGGTQDTVGGVGDAWDLTEALKRAGFRPEDVRVLTDRQASAQAIRDGLRWLGDTSADNGLSVFHYSGHVKQIGGDLDRDGEDLDEYLWGADNHFIADGELAGWVKRIRGRTWIDIAGCEAAGFDDGISGPTRLFTASSLEHEKSFEHPEWRNSVFTHLLVDKGMLQGQADTDGKKRVSIQEAFLLAEREAPRVTANQRPSPQHPIMTGGDNKQWYLDLPKPAPTPERCLLICL